MNHQKYDRQLRLWGTHGQQKLQDSHILLVGSTFTGCETLKNLVLPGIGQFTILDDHIVTEEDAGSNFFIEKDDIGSFQAECVVRNLKELNPDSISEYLKDNTLEKFDFVIICDGFEAELLSIGDICRHLSIPLVLVRSYGMYGYFRIDVKEHFVVEAHPENVIDLRLDVPWKELQEHLESINFETDDTFILSHIPFPFLLLKAMQKWCQEHNSIFPPKGQDRQKFYELIKSLTNYAEDDENVQEAISNCHRLFIGTKIPLEILSILNDDCTKQINQNTNLFWVIVKALKLFVENEGSGHLPLSGKVPDMKSDTESFVMLQKLYHSKATKDAEIVERYANQILSSLGRPLVEKEQVIMFCKNASFLDVCRFSSIRDEYQSTSLPSLTNDFNDNSNNIIYFLLRSADRFHNLHKRYPGTIPQSYDSDILAFGALVGAFLKEFGITEVNSKEYVQEFIRAGCCQLPSVGAFMGGIASQEIIKLVTQQYVPVKNAIVYNGVASSTTTYII